MKPTFTVLLPVHRSPVLLPFAVESALAQEREDFELLIVCDGAPEATVEYARAAAQRDARIRVHAHPKGERHGELYRHQALEKAEGSLVCGLADDDLWFPNHLAEMEKLLAEFEFGNLLHVAVRADGSIYEALGDLAAPKMRAKMCKKKFNLFGITSAGFRLSTYHRLPVGWAPAPTDVWTDLHMWRKFLALPGIACATRIAVTSLNFPTPHRQDWPLEKRRDEMKDWADRIKDPRARDQIAQQIFQRWAKATLNWKRERAKIKAQQAAA
jgi:glycosyltransferase involved in cell wall biosynthesis